MACQLSACIGLIINTFRCKISKHEATKQVTVGDQTTANKSIRETGILNFSKGTNCDTREELLLNIPKSTTTHITTQLKTHLYDPGRSHILKHIFRKVSETISHNIYTLLNHEEKKKTKRFSS